MQAQPTALRSLGLHGINCIDGIAIAHRYHSTHYKSATSTRPDSTVTLPPQAALRLLRVTTVKRLCRYSVYRLLVMGERLCLRKVTRTMECPPLFTERSAVNRGGAPTGRRGWCHCRGSLPTLTPYNPSGSSTHLPYLLR